MSARRIAVGLALSAVLATPGSAWGQASTPTVGVPTSDSGPSAAAERATAGQVGAESIGPARDWMPTIPQIFGGLGHDFLRLASNDALLITGVGATAAIGARTMDGRIAASASGWDGGFAREALEPGRIVGGALVQSSAAFATYVMGRVTDSPRLARVGAELTRAQIVAQGVTQAIKIGTRRTRPDGTALSFPSGHTAATFATASVLQREFGWKAGVPAYAGAAWVAASRVQAERHFLSDVVAGATVGILAGRAVTFGRGGARFSLAPTAVPGGIALSVVRVKQSSD